MNTTTPWNIGGKLNWQLCDDLSSLCDIHLILSDPLLPFHIYLSLLAGKNHTLWRFLTWFSLRPLQRTGLIFLFFIYFTYFKYNPVASIYNCLLFCGIVQVLVFNAEYWGSNNLICTNFYLDWLSEFCLDFWYKTVFSKFWHDWVNFNVIRGHHLQGVEPGLVPLPNLSLCQSYWHWGTGK